MTIKDEAPILFVMLERHHFHSSKTNEIAKTMTGLEVLREAVEPGSLISQYFVEGDKIRAEIDEEILRTPITERAIARLLEEIKSCISDNTINRIDVDLVPAIFNEFSESCDWFQRTDLLEGSVLDRSTAFSIVHPGLYDEALERLGGEPRCNFSRYAESPSLSEKFAQLAGRHGIPNDSASWWWCIEALQVSENALERLGLKYSLCDFVKWSCDEEPPIISNRAVIGEPNIFSEAKFGDRLVAGEYKRCDSVKVWRIGESMYVSPLWEYLGHRAHSLGADGEELATNLAYLGEGLDAASLHLDADADPEDPHRSRLTPAHIFRAGEAMVNLRIKLELESFALKGKKAAAVEKVRAARAGKKSAETRNARRAALMSAIEALVARSPDLARPGAQPVVLNLALEDCIKTHPGLWSQGRGQAGEYLGEISRGEAGPELQARYLTIFPRKPLKQFSRP